MPIDDTMAPQVEPTQPEPETTETAEVTQTAEDPIAKRLKGRITKSKTERKKFIDRWQRNVDLRMGKVNTLAGETSTANSQYEDDTPQSEINPDWSLTKTKTANLFSQVPEVRGTHDSPAYAPAIPPFMKALNYEIGPKRAKVGVAMEESLNDIVNAAGIGAIYVNYAGRFIFKEVPAITTFPTEMGPVPIEELLPGQVEELIKAKAIPTMTVPQTVSAKITARRISPPDLLWPPEFNGSDFNDADYIGRTGRLPWSEAKHEFKLTDEQKAAAVGGDDPSKDSDLRAENGQECGDDEETVVYDEVYYWRYRVDPEEKSFDAIWKLVYVRGIPEPVIHEAWKGQKLIPGTTQYVGCRRFPIQIGTVTYVSDNPIPPSDSEAARPQVNDLRLSRTQMFQNRRRSIPIRWFDVNRIDSQLQGALMRGTVQGMIPTNGDGSRSVGEIARASYPAEDLSFDQITKSELQESWQVGPNQLGTSQPGRKTANEATIVQQNFATRIGQERERVAQFFLRVVDVIAGYLLLYSDFPCLSDQERETMRKAWDQQRITHDLVLTVRPDSTIVLDVEQRIQRIMRFLNMTVKSGFVNPAPLIAEFAELSGLDPALVMTKPTPPPDKPNMSFRFSGSTDLQNPIVMAILLKHGEAPSKEQVRAAKELLVEGSTAPVSPEMSGAPGMPGGPGAPGGPGGPGGPGLPPNAPSRLTAPTDPQATGGDQFPGWGLAEKVASRTEDIGG